MSLSFVLTWALYYLLCLLYLLVLFLHLPFLSASVVFLVIPPFLKQACIVLQCIPHFLCFCNFSATSVTPHCGCSLSPRWPVLTSTLWSAGRWQTDIQSGPQGFELWHKMDFKFHNPQSICPCVQKRRDRFCYKKVFFDAHLVCNK